MLVATWNVNSVRARLPRLLAWLEERRPDVVLLQETKCQDEAFPREPIEDLGYSIAHHGQKTYNGVAILARGRIEGVERGLDAGEARVIAGTVGDLIVASVYVINGVEVGHPRYHDKLAFLARLGEWLAERFPPGEKLVLGGDFNVTVDDRDVHDPERWREKILCSTPEREAFAGLCAHGYTDAFRRFHEEGGHYTWWDFRTRAFRWDPEAERATRNDGLRIDHLLLSEAALAACRSAEIDVAARGGEKPSDHAPVLVALA